MRVRAPGWRWRGTGVQGLLHPTRIPGGWVSSWPVPAARWEQQALMFVYTPGPRVAVGVAGRVTGVGDSLALGGVHMQGCRHRCCLCHRRSGPGWLFVHACVHLPCHACALARAGVHPQSDVILLDNNPAVPEQGWAGAALAAGAAWTCCRLRACMVPVLGQSLGSLGRMMRASMGGCK